MATWEDVKRFIHSHYKATDVSDDLIKLVFETHDLRSQLVFVGRETILDDQEWATIASPFAKIGSVDLTEALDAVSSYVVGGLYRAGDLLMVKDAFPLRNLDSNELTDPMRLVVLAADFVEQKLGTGDDF